MFGVYVGQTPDSVPPDNVAKQAAGIFTNERIAAFRGVFACMALLLMVGCAPVRRYWPQPLSPAETASNLEARSLIDAGLRWFIEQNVGQKLRAWPPNAWDLRLLTLAAFYFSPTLDAARARAVASEAAIVTAGARPNPTIALTPGVPSPYLLTFDFQVPIETAGKRGYRLEEARNLSEAAKLDLAETAWKVRSGVRAALLDHFTAVRDLALLRLEEETRTQQVRLLGQRLQVGDVARPELAASRLALLTTQVATRAAEGRVAATRAALAAAIGIPVSGMENAQLSWSDFEQPPAPQTLSPKLIQREAVLNRLDVRRTLAEYAAAEAALQLEIAKQYPDFQIGPGYQLEERNSFFTVGLAVTLPIRNRNQGPIAEAEARRKEVAARFLSTQAQVIAQSEAALARYGAALRELSEARESLTRLQDEREQMTTRAVQIGESDRLTLNAVTLERSAVAQAWFGTLVRAQQALGELEDAVERPLEPGDIPQLIPQSPAAAAPKISVRQ
jgi:outer membrane protein TolC